MIVTVQPGAGAEGRPRVRLALTRAEIARVLAGGSLPFELTAEGLRRRVELLRIGGEPAREGPPPDHRLHVPEGLFRGVSVGGAATPIFPDLPFSLTVELAAGEAPVTGPVRVSPGVVYERLDARPYASPPLPRPAVPSPAPAVARPARAAVDADAPRAPSPWSLLLSGLVLLAVGVIGVLAGKNVPLGVLLGLAGLAVMGWAIARLRARSPTG
jgi:hypothetical protein